MSSSKRKAGDHARVLEIFRALCIGVDSPRSLKAALLVKYEEWQQLAEMKIDPKEYVTAHAFFGDYSVVSFLKKNKDLPKVADTRAAAIAAFKRSEQNCELTNSLFRSWSVGHFQMPSRVVQVIHLAQRKIANLLGGCEPLVVSAYSWGPGATFDMSRKRAYPDTKLVKLPFSVTASALKYAASAIQADLHWKAAIIEANSGYSGPVFELIQGGRYDTVAKTVLTDRSILVEPRLNTVLQKMVGSQLRALLKTVGVDLDDQSRNQALAAFAYECGYATLDLEAASDSVSTKLVEILLPPAWFEVMDDLRSKEYLLDGVWTKLEKFSSMGNGYTFELETLIFWALSSASNDITASTTLGVYGDDIIVHRRTVPLVSMALHVCGFTLNKAKSFIEGCFFESCGAHYYEGINVTPLYQKETPRDGPTAIRLGNRILRCAARSHGPSYLDKRFEGAWRAARRVYEIPDDRTGPYLGVGDGYLEVPYFEYADRVRLKSFGSSLKVRSYGEQAVTIPGFSTALLALRFSASGDGKEPFDFQIIHSRKGWTIRSLKIPDPPLLASDEVASRVSSRLVTTHRWVEITHASTVLGW